MYNTSFEYIAGTYQIKTVERNNPKKIVICRGDILIKYIIILIIISLYDIILANEVFRVM